MSELDHPTLVAVGLITIYLIWLLSPLVVAVATYLIAPKEAVVVQGPLKGLAVRASGAFAAYFIVLVFSAPLAWKGLDWLAGLSKTSWTIEAPVRLIDSEGNNISPDNPRIEVEFFPKLHELSIDRVIMRIPLSKDEWREMYINVPGFGSARVDLKTVQMEIYRKDNLAILSLPITIKKQPETGFGVPSF